MSKSGKLKRRRREVKAWMIDPIWLICCDVIIHSYHNIGSGGINQRSIWNMLWDKPMNPPPPPPQKKKKKWCCVDSINYQVFLPSIQHCEIGKLPPRSKQYYQHFTDIFVHFAEVFVLFIVSDSLEVYCLSYRSTDNKSTLIQIMAVMACRCNRSVR